MQKTLFNISIYPHIEMESLIVTVQVHNTANRSLSIKKSAVCYDGLVSGPKFTINPGYETCKFPFIYTKPSYLISKANSFLKFDVNLSSYCDINLQNPFAYNIDFQTTINPCDELLTECIGQSRYSAFSEIATDNITEV